MESPVIRDLANRTATRYFNSGKFNVGKPSDKQLICLTCDLPGSKCKYNHCKRYIGELNKLKGNSNG